MSRINAIIMNMRQGMYVMEAMEEGVRSYKNCRKEAKSRPLKLRAEPSIFLEDLTLGYEALDHPVLESLITSFRTWADSCGGWSFWQRKEHFGQCDAWPASIGSRKNSHSGWHVAVDAWEDCSRESWLAELGYLSQQPFFFGGSVRDNLTFRAPGREVDEDLVLKLIGKLGLETALGETPLSFILNEAGNNLSGGQQQRLALLRSLAGRHQSSFVG